MAKKKSKNRTNQNRQVAEEQRLQNEGSFNSGYADADEEDRRYAEDYGEIYPDESDSGSLYADEYAYQTDYADYEEEPTVAIDLAADKAAKAEAKRAAKLAKARAKAEAKVAKSSSKSAGTDQTNGKEGSNPAEAAETGTPVEEVVDSPELWSTPADVIFSAEMVEAVDPDELSGKKKSKKKKKPAKPAEESGDIQNAGGNEEGGENDGTEATKGTKGTGKKSSSSKKFVLILGIIFVALLLALVIIQLVSGKKKKTECTDIFADTDYPCCYWMDKEVMQFKLDGSKTADLLWDVRVRDSEVLEVGIKGEEKNGKATYTFTPQKEGTTEVFFYRKRTFEEKEYDAVKISLPMYVSKEEGAFVIKIMDYAALEDFGCVLCGNSTEYPYLLNNQDGVASILFLKGKGNWTLSADGTVSLETVFVSEAETLIYVRDNRETLQYILHPSTEEVSSEEAEANSEDDMEPDTSFVEGTATDASGTDARPKVRIAESDDEIEDNTEAASNEAVTGDPNATETNISVTNGTITETVHVRFADEGKIYLSLNKEK